MSMFQAAENAIFGSPKDTANQPSTQAVADLFKTVVPTFDTVALLLADTTLTHSDSAGTVNAGDAIIAAQFVYRAAESGATDQHVTTAGSLKLYVQRTATGDLPAEAFGIAANDGTTDESAKVQAVLDAESYDQNAGAFGSIVWPPYDIYVGSVVNLRRRQTWRGSGRTNALYAHSADHAGTRFICDSADMFQNDTNVQSGKVQQLTCEDISFWSKSGGGIIFNMNAVTNATVENIFFNNCAFSQENTGKEIWKSPTVGDAFVLHHEGCNYYWPIGTTVRMLDFTANTTNNITIKRFTATKADKTDSTGVPFLRMDRASGGAVTSCEISDGVLQQTIAGFAEIHAPDGFVGRNLHVYDATVDASNPVFDFKASSGGVQPVSATLISCKSENGASTAIPDLKWTTTNSETGLVLIDCEMEYMNLGGDTRYATAFGTTPTQDSKLSGTILQMRGQGFRSITSKNGGSTTEVKFNGDGRFVVPADTFVNQPFTEFANETATLNNWEPGTSKVDVSFTSAKSITGFANGSDGDLITIYNSGTFTCTMRHNHANSSTGNKLRNNGAADLVLNQYETAQYVYRATDGFWLQLGS